MTIDDFFAKWNGKGVDFDGYFGDQCVDLYQEYNRDVIGGPVMHGNAVDFFTSYPDCYEKIANTPTNFPQKGDVIIWGVSIGQFGHIAVCSSANENTFISFDQNWDTPHFHLPDGQSYCRFVNHSYNGVLGWLRPKAFEPSITPGTQPPTPVTSPEPPQTPVVQNSTTTTSETPTAQVEVVTTPENQLNIVPAKNTDFLILRLIGWLMKFLNRNK